jgi:ABC-2 type transport system ATP-binding protein
MTVPTWNAFPSNQLTKKHFRKISEVFFNPMAHQALKDYLEQARAAGLNNEQIMTALTEAGWHAHDLLDIVIDRPTASETAEEIISVRNVSKNYGAQVKALDNVSLGVKKGSVTALLGPNGAGKTTLVRILSTLLLPDDGTVTVAGFDAVKDAQELRSVIGLAGQYAAVDEILTGRENLEMVGRLYHLGKAAAKARAQELLEQFDLVEAADRTLKTYSGGMRRRLDLAASLVNCPKILFLDEPTTGLDPRSRFALWNVIRDLVADGTTVLLTTQYLEEADQLAHHIFVIDHGHIIAQGTSDDLKNQVGGNVLEVHLSKHEEALAAGKVLAQFGEEAPHVDEENGSVSLPIAGGAEILVEAIRSLDAAKIKISNVGLRRPSLDDVFMKLTGHSAQ